MNGIDCKGKKWEEIPIGRAIDLTNKTFNNLTALFRVKTIYPGTWWLFQCKCGNKIACRNNAVTSGNTISCGCQKYKTNLNDLSGQRFGKLTVLSRERDSKNKMKWKCKCDCGNITYISTANLRTSLSCGCLRGFQDHIDAEQYNLIGQKFGYLTVIERVASDANGKACYKCICDCGNKTIAQACALRSGKRCSCGQCHHSMSQGELEIKQILDNHNVKYFYDTRYFKDLIMSGGGIGRYDFILIDENKQPYRIIEFDGRQHSNENSIYYMKQKGQRYQDVEINDKIKNNYALMHHIPLIRIPYKQLRHITYEMLMNDEYLVEESE